MSEEGNEELVQDVGTQRPQENPMHACPLGMYLAGMNLVSGKFLCGYDRRRKELAGQTEQPDGKPINEPTAKDGMHVCPRPNGSLTYLTGFHEGDNRFLCGRFKP